MWTGFILLLGLISLVLVSLNFAPSYENFSLIKTVADPNLYQLSQGQVIQDVSKAVPTMQLASPIFDTWVKSFRSENLILVDDSSLADIYGSVSTPITMVAVDDYPGIQSNTQSSDPSDPIAGNVFHSMREATVNDSTNSTISPNSISYSDLITHCTSAADASKAISEWIIAANDLGTDYSTLFVGVPPAVDSDNSEPISTRASQLQYPPNVQNMCRDMDTISLHYLMGVMCTNLQNTPEIIHSTDVYTQCAAEQISNCGTFMDGILRYNLTNAAFKTVGEAPISPMVTAIFYRQQSADLSSSCGRVTSLIRDRLPYFHAISTKQEVNGPVLFFIVIGGSFVVLLLLAFLIIGHRFITKNFGTHPRPRMNYPHLSDDRLSRRLNNREIASSPPAPWQQHPTSSRSEVQMSPV
jgi:hypothetical protein